MLLLLPLALLFSSCNGTHTSSSHTKINPDRMAQQDTQQQTASDSAAMPQHPIEQGIAGKVLWKSGNQMPSPDAPPSKGRGVQRTVYVYQLTNAAQVTTTNGVFHTNITTKLVTQVETDAAGNFAVSLAPGRYSLFSQEDQGLFANRFDGENNIYPVEVQQGQVTAVEFVINYKASY
ncbi:carboxypeptidase regulatory-like domain-containing protein [Pontibacter sp. E15-1]|uniref:carboxypeptidase regulatory-like domain-containing protein n=1 Tax=Pontibacter sp. E15-1 TaxID=2919918 RepID=UPI001F4F58C8|nr:carboxypeptidase regulatory-like domain-containing protein [Pontibacter sp. E15-1]MCJ8163895.1 carboxypeptidase regulatory-like domain-containing protein [Pontibacter sp. E15-1]